MLYVLLGRQNPYPPEPPPKPTRESPRHPLSRALLAPSTGACDAFRRINFEGRFRHLWSSGNAVVEYAEACRSLDISVLSLACSESEWQERLSSLQTRVQEWWQHAASRKSIFGPAGDVWRKWLRREQLVFQLLQPIKHDDASKLPSIRAEFLRLSGEVRVRQEIEQVDRQVVRAVFVADPQIAWYLSSGRVLEDLAEKDVKTQSLGPWHDSAFQHWLDACELTSSDARDRIAHVTGRWPLLLYTLREHVSDLGNASEAVEALERKIDEPAIRQGIETAFGLTISQPRQVLTALAAYGSALAVEELVHLLDPPLPADIVRQGIVWADLLRLINAAGQGC